MTDRSPFRIDDQIQQALWEAPLKRVIKVNQGSVRFGALCPTLSKTHPSLYAFLCDQEYDAADGGGKRETGVLSVWINGGSWHAKLSDKDSGHCCYVAASSWSELLAALDAAASDPAGGWKPDPGARQGRKK